jgi:hypothetical protein
MNASPVMNRFQSIVSEFRSVLWYFIYCELSDYQRIGAPVRNDGKRFFSGKVLLLVELL